MYCPLFWRWLARCGVRGDVCRVGGVSAVFDGDEVVVGEGEGWGVEDSGDLCRDVAASAVGDVKVDEDSFVGGFLFPSCPLLAAAATMGQRAFVRWCFLPVRLRFRTCGHLKGSVSSPLGFMRLEIVIWLGFLC